MGGRGPRRPGKRVEPARPRRAIRSDSSCLQSGAFPESRGKSRLICFRPNLRPNRGSSDPKPGRFLASLPAGGKITLSLCIGATRISIFAEEAWPVYAVIMSGGKQYRVVKGDRVRLERLDADSGSEVEFKEVLLVKTEDRSYVGQPEE